MAVVYQTATQDIVDQLDKIRQKADSISEDARLRLEYDITRTVSSWINSMGLTAQISQELLNKVITPFNRQHP
jgi:hypothetical protein